MNIVMILTLWMFFVGKDGKETMLWQDGVEERSLDCWRGWDSCKLYQQEWWSWKLAFSPQFSRFSHALLLCFFSCFVGHVLKLYFNNHFSLLETKKFPSFCYTQKAIKKNAALKYLSIDMKHMFLKFDFFYKKKIMVRL